MDRLQAHREHTGVVPPCADVRHTPPALALTHEGARTRTVLVKTTMARPVKRTRNARHQLVPWNCARRPAVQVHHSNQTIRGPTPGLLGEGALHRPPWALRVGMVAHALQGNADAPYCAHSMHLCIALHILVVHAMHILYTQTYIASHTIYLYV